jgi:transposase
MSKVQFKSYSQGQTVLFPSRIDEKIPENNSVRLIKRIVEGLDLTQLIATYESRGTTPYNLRMLLKIVFHACINNVCSCRKIASAMERNIHYMWPSGSQYPPYSTISRFRSEHIKDCVNRLSVQVVELPAETGQISLFDYLCRFADCKRVLIARFSYGLPSYA